MDPKRTERRRKTPLWIGVGLLVLTIGVGATRIAPHSSLIGDWNVMRGVLTWRRRAWGCLVVVVLEVECIGKGRISIQIYISGADRWR